MSEEKICGDKSPACGWGQMSRERPRWGEVLQLCIAAQSCNDDDRCIESSVAVDHTTTKTTSTVFDSALLATLERLHFGDKAPDCPDRPAGRTAEQTHEVVRDDLAYIDSYIDEINEN